MADEKKPSGSPPTDPKNDPPKVKIRPSSGDRGIMDTRQGKKIR